jgi:CDP-diacylglycerol--glycerol-3-phosphate 3-phosphatidyltransferase
MYKHTEQQNSINQSSQRIGLSSLYLGTGTLERHLLANIANRHKRCPDLQSAMVFDHHRSQREEHGDSPFNILTKFTEEIGSKAQVAFLQIGNGRGVVGEVLAVHHQKVYIFDDRVVMGGANLSKNYFLNRKDRYISISSSELSDYLFDYLQVLAEQPEANKLNRHYKLWKYGYMPSKY